MIKLAIIGVCTAIFVGLASTKKNAMPPWIKDTAEGTNTDWNNPIQKYWKKSWFSYGPRAESGWAKWREYPKTLLALFGKGSLRLETETWERDSSTDAVFPVETIRNKELHFVAPDETLKPAYLSAIQYYCRWHIAIQWPLHIQFHYYFKESSVPVYGQPRGEMNNKLFYFRLGARRDGDKVYWTPSVFVGLTWN